MTVGSVVVAAAVRVVGVSVAQEEVGGGVRLRRVPENVVAQRRDEAAKGRHRLEAVAVLLLQEVRVEADLQLVVDGRVLVFRTRL